MPIFEYLCKSCGKPFEFLLRGSEKPRCPACKSTRLEQQLSAFAVAGSPAASSGADSGPGPAGGCGNCGTGGACSFDDD